MKTEITNIKYLSGAAVLGVAGFGAYGAPRGPDSVTGWMPMVGAFLLFLFFLGAAFSAGSLLTRYLVAGADVSVRLATGLALFAFAGECLGLAGGLQYFPGAGMLLLILLPLAAFGLSPRERASSPAPPVISAGLGAILFLLWFCLSWIPDSMPDPLWYDLTAARWWMEAGAFRHAPVIAAFFQSGSWDALLLWGNYLLGSPGEGGLIGVQFFGQWLQLIAGGGLVAALLWRISFSFFPALSREGRGFLVLLSLLSVSQLRTLPLAKNDWGASALLLASVACWLGTRRPAALALAGFLAGMAFSAKSSVGYAMIALFPLAWAIRRPGAGERALFLLAGVLACLPWMIRNSEALGNPFFPALQGFFPGTAGPSWRRFAELYEGAAFSYSGKSWLLKEMLADSPFLFLLIPGALALLRPGRARPREAVFCALVLGVLLLFFLKAGIRAEFRLLGPVCLLAIFAPLGSVFTWLEQRPWAPGKRIAAYLGCFVISLAWLSWLGQFPWRAPVVALAQRSPTEEIRSHFGGTVLAWARLNLPAGKKVASANEFRLYYLSGRRAFRIWDDPMLDRDLYLARNARDIVGTLRRAGIDYLIFTRMDWDVFFRKEALDALEAAWSRHREAIVFGNENSKLIDLALLAGALE